MARQTTLVDLRTVLRVTFGCLAWRSDSSYQNNEYCPNFIGLSLGDDRMVRRDAHRG